MYERFYGFRDRPFRLTPDPAYLFLSQTHREAYAHLLYGIRENVGFVSITGEIGAGKTTLVRAAIKETGDQASVAYIFDPVLSSIDLLQTINAEFGLPHRSVSKRELTAVLNDYLMSQRGEGKRSVVVIDEAQNLRPVILEQLRLLSNLETDTEKLLQIVLLGQPELRALLERPELAQLSQRMTVRWHIRPLGLAEAAEYVRHRVLVAGGEDVFDDEALAMIYRSSGGVPRMINIVAHRALLVGYGRGSQLIGPDEVSTATIELAEGRHGHGFHRADWWSRLLAAGGAALAAGLVAFFLLPPVVDRTVATASNHAAFETTDRTRLAAALSSTEAFNSARTAIGRLLELWEVRAAGDGEGLDLERLATARGLRYSAFGAGPSLLSILDLPAIVEITNGDDGVRYLLVEAIDRSHFIVHVDGARTAIATGELARLWNGNAHLLWRDSRGLGGTLGSASSGQAVTSLQKMLARAGLYLGPATGLYDEATEKAVRNFQIGLGLVPDGIAGAVTQVLLYKGSGTNGGPSLRPAT
jgi:general secretion pathway protein A